ETSRMSSSREAQGSRPSTFSSPWYEVRPRIALSTVVFPAPLGPIIPRMRPSSTRKLMPSSATVVPNDLRRPRASMHAIASALLFLGIGFGGFRWLGILCWVCAVQKFFCLQAEPLNIGVNARPFVGKKFLALALQQQITRAGIDEHAQATPRFNQAIIHQLLIAFKDRERIDAIFSGDSAH